MVKILGIDIPAGYSLLLQGNPGVGKTKFACSIFKHALGAQRKGVYVALESPPGNVINTTPRDDVRFVYLDCHSWKAGGCKDKYSVRNLTNLNELSVKTLSAASEIGEDFFYVVNSISNLHIYCSENEILRFLDVVSAHYLTHKGTGIWVVENGIHSQSFYNMLRHITNGTLEIKIDDLGSKKLVRWTILRGHVHSDEWVEFTIDKDGSILFPTAQEL